MFLLFTLFSGPGSFQRRLPVFGLLVGAVHVPVLYLLWILPRNLGRISIDSVIEEATPILYGPGLSLRTGLPGYKLDYTHRRVEGCPPATVENRIHGTVLQPRWKSARRCREGPGTGHFWRLMRIRTATHGCREHTVQRLPRLQVQLPGHRLPPGLRFLHVTNNIRSVVAGTTICHLRWSLTRIWFMTSSPTCHGTDCTEPRSPCAVKLAHPVPVVRGFATRISANAEIYPYGLHQAVACALGDHPPLTKTAQQPASVRTFCHTLVPPFLSLPLVVTFCFLPAG